MSFTFGMEAPVSGSPVVPVLRDPVGTRGTSPVNQGQLGLHDGAQVVNRVQGVLHGSGIAPVSGAGDNDSHCQGAFPSRPRTHSEMIRATPRIMITAGHSIGLRSLSGIRCLPCCPGP